LIKNEAIMTVPSSASLPAFPAETATIVFESFDRFQRVHRIDIASWFLLTSVYFSNVRDSSRMMLALTPVTAIELARLTGLSRETVRRKLQILLHKGLVRKVNRSWVVTDLCVHGNRTSA
jgi:CRP-like cAMP-binding protein